MNEEFPANWKSFDLKDICFFQEGPGLRNWQYSEKGTKFINIRCIKDGYLDTSNSQFISSDEVESKYNHFLLNEGDYVLSSSGTIGRIAVVHKYDLPLLLNTSVIRFRTLDESKLDTKYLFYFLQSKQFYEKIFEQSQGSAQVNFGPSHLKLLNASFPPIPEQKKIAEILSGIDKTINATVAEKIYIERTKISIIQQLTRGLNHKGIRKNSGTEFGMIPSHWNCEPLPDCCKLENSKRKPIKAEDRKEMRGQYPYHGATKIQDYISEYSFEGEYTLIGEDGDHFSKYKSWEMAQYATGRFNVSNHAHAISSTSKCSSKWLYYSMLHRDLTLYLTR